jgi:hypothetical protein
MPFTGTPSILQLSEREVVIHGLSLASDASGRIGLFRSTLNPEVRLPQAFVAEPYHYQGGIIRLSDAVQIDFTLGLTPGGFTNLMPSVQTSGTTPEDFEVTITNTNTGEPTQPLTIRVRNARSVQT